MPGKSDYLETAVLNGILRNTGFLAQTGSVYISLHTADPTDAANGAEVSGGAYARVAVSRATGSWAAPSDVAGAQTTSNSAAITFPSPTGTWGTVTYFGVWDAATTGNMYYSGALGTSRSPVNGDVAPQFAIGALVISES